MAIPCKLAEKENECLDKPVIRVEKGRIGSADVELMLDSGACISVISVKTWGKIVEVNGVEWEKKLTKGKADLRQVVTANNQPLKLLYTVEVETSMLTRTRLIKYYVADIDRDNIILGMDQFNKLGVEVRIEEQPRAIKLCKDIRLVPSSAKVIQVSVEGVMLEGKDQCLVTPMHECIATSVCEVGADGKAYVTVSNFGTKSILLRKGQQIAGGEVDDFEVLQEKVAEENWKETEATVCNLVQKDTDSERWNTLCEHLKKQESNCESEEEIWKVIQSFQHIFAVSDSELGRTNATTCEIELLQGAEPIRQRPRPIPLAIRPQIREILQKMLAQDVIRVSKSPWSSPVVIVKKKDGSVRMCVDYRKVNKVVKNNAHPLPHIEATLQSLTGKKIFTTLDLLAGYWQIPLEERSKEITAFAIGSELFEYNVLPFGLVTSPAVFQATMEAVVGDLLGKNAFVYVDDLLIASETMEKHIQDLKEILIRLEASGMKLRASKCHIAQREVEYLGHRITPEGVKTEETKVNKMKNFTRPENAEQMRSFLGLTGYYRKFMLNYAQVASELTPLTSVKVAWVWQAEQEKAFQELIQLICSAPVLMQPNIEQALDGSRPFMIYCDASKKGVGAVLAQEGDDGLQHPIAFSSKALSPAEKRYHITDLEALAMMSALRKFKTITYGTSVVVFTDHKPLISLLKGSPLSDRLMRWSIEIMQFDVKIVYIAGQANVVADALSRGGCPPIEVEESETAELPNIIGEIRDKGDDDESEMWNMENWLELLKREEGWCEVIRLLEENNTEEMVKLPGVKGEISVENYALVGKSLRNIEDERYNRHVVPESVRLALVKEAHSGKVAGHFGTDKIWRQLSKRYYWPKMRVTIERVVRTCPKCLCTNDHPKLIAPLKPYETSAPLEIVACDLIDVGLSAQGNKYILTIIDLFTKYATAVPIADKKGETVVKAFTERWAIGEGRIPNKLLTDMGKEFNNEHFKQLTKLLKIEHIMTKGYNSRANGAVERFNKTLMHIMNKKSAVPIEWDDQVAFAVYAYNSVAHSTTGESPMYLMTGRDPKGPLEMAGEDAVGINYTDVDEYKHLMTSELLKAHALAKEHAQKEREKYKQLFDQKHNTEKRKYPETGSRVLVEIPSEKLGARCPKLVNKWKGPYRVIACSDNSATVVPAWGKGKESLVIPFDHLRVIPNEMGNDPIETVKSRARQRVEINTMHILDKEKHLMNNFCSDLYACRCPTQCHFGLQEVPNVTTTAPTQLQRMAELVKRIPALKSKEKSAELLLLTQKQIQGLEVTPDAHTLKAMSHCPTLALWVQDVRGWKDAYDQCRNELLLKHVGCNLGSIKTIQAVLAPNVNASEFPVVLRHKCVVKSAENAVAEVTEQLLKVNTDLLLLVVPFSPSEDDQTMWRDLVNAVPSSTTIYLVPAYMKSFDHQKMEQFIALFERVKRDKGELYHVSPNDIVEGKQNRKLYSASELVDPQEYWTIVQTLLKERKLEWPKFQVSKKEEKKPANQATVSGSEEKTRQEGGSSAPSTSDRHHPYMEVYRGRGRGRSGRGGGFRRETYHPYNHISK
ncbi:hypothetical protein CRE_00852 [Caenorhabditis remanei]|uniref:RNA-directed DNA polymerase n=1 Tax=Caenorhabditis remanei TaxID=31234 RepID=E3LEP6_CAERE|nr:hypothetical protein CRE_00852 [Caenorhabditis remanei]